MPNHWHLVLWPRKDGELAAFMQRLTVTHVTRWQEHFHCVGQGHVYQGRYKSFPVESDQHFLSVCRYVERNPLRAGLVEKVADWRWSSLWRRINATGGPAPGTAPAPGVEELPTLSAWPLGPPEDWPRRLNQPESKVELEALRQSIACGRPYGSERWQARTVAALGLEHTLRDRGRPRKLKGQEEAH
jgi:putative transposase